MIAVPAHAQGFSEPQRTEIQKIIKDYLLAHPEVLQEAMAELEKKQQSAETEKARSAIKNHSDALFNSPRQVVLGNPQGDVTFVEFFDYNCGYCKRALNDMVELMSKDPKLKVIPSVERELIIQALKETAGNQVHAAKLLGITRATLRKRVEKFGIQKELNIK